MDSGSHQDHAPVEKGEMDSSEDWRVFRLRCRSNQRRSQQEAIKEKFKEMKKKKLIKEHIIVVFSYVFSRGLFGIFKQENEVDFELFDLSDKK